MPTHGAPSTLSTSQSKPNGAAAVLLVDSAVDNRAMYAEALRVASFRRPKSGTRRMRSRW